MASHLCTHKQKKMKIKHNEKHSTSYANKVHPFEKYVLSKTDVKHWKVSVWHSQQNSKKYIHRKSRLKFTQNFFSKQSPLEEKGIIVAKNKTEIQNKNVKEKCELVTELYYTWG